MSHHITKLKFLGMDDSFQCILDNLPASLEQLEIILYNNQITKLTNLPACLRSITVYGTYSRFNPSLVDIKSPYGCNVIIDKVHDLSRDF